MNRVFLPILLAMACAPAHVLALVASPDRPDALGYVVGDPVVFSFSSSDVDFGEEDPSGFEWAWSVAGEGGSSAAAFAPFVQGSPLVLTNRFSAPGFLRANASIVRVGSRNPVRGRGFSGAVVAGAGLTELPVDSEPSDFDAFWAAALAEIAPEKLPSGTGSLIPAPESDAARSRGHRISAFVVPLGPGRAPATGWVSWPAQAPIRGCPLVVRFGDYGLGPEAFPADFPRDALFVLVQTHGFVPGMPRDRKVAAFNAMSNGGVGGAYGFRPHENDDAENSVFRGIVQRAVAAVRYARTIPVWDRINTTLEGRGQGAWTALACAALDGDDTMRLNLVSPWLCGLGRDSSWQPDFVPALRYFDGVNFASRVRAPVTIEARLFDTTCAPSSVLRVRNALPDSATPDIRWTDAP